MNSEEFREFGKAAVDYIADYVDTIRDRPVLPSVQPGYLATMVPEEMPHEGEDWRQIMKDMDTVIMPGMTHWQSPQFHAYFPTASSFPSIVGDMLSGALGVVGFSWLSSPACTELEVLCMNWLGKAMGLPEEFLNCSTGPGGGIIQGSASEATLVAVLVAKRRTVLRMQAEDPSLTENHIKNRLVAYTSDQSNSSVEKSGIIGDVPMRLLESDERGVLRGDTLLAAVKQDIALGKIPCCLVASMGTTGTCAFDALEELGPICEQFKIWLHIDAAYAGAALLLPEYQHLKRGLQYADSFDFNPHKWLLVNFDCSAMWVKDANHLMNAFFIDRIYLKHTDAPMNTQSPDYMHWQIPLGRRFRALKLWMTLRVYGVKGLQEHLRKQISLAKYFASLVEENDRFQLMAPPSMGLACFRLKGDNELNKLLYERLTARKVIYLVKGSFRGQLLLRFAVCSRLTEEKDVELAWTEIKTAAQEVLEQSSKIQTATQEVLEQSSEIQTAAQEVLQQSSPNTVEAKSKEVKENKRALGIECERGVDKVREMDTGAACGEKNLTQPLVNAVTVQ